MICKTLTHDRINAKLGECGMGVVYRATDIRLGRLVAIMVQPSSDTWERRRPAGELKENER